MGDIKKMRNHKCGNITKFIRALVFLDILYSSFYYPLQWNGTEELNLSQTY